VPFSRSPLSKGQANLPLVRAEHEHRVGVVLAGDEALLRVARFDRGTLNQTTSSALVRLVFRPECLRVRPVRAESEGEQKALLVAIPVFIGDAAPPPSSIKP